MPSRRLSQTVPIEKKHNRHYLGIFFVLLIALVLFGVYSPVSLTGELTGGPVLDLFSSNTPASALILFVLIFGILLLFFFTHRMLSRVI